MDETQKPGVIALDKPGELHLSERTSTEELQVQDEVLIPPIFDGDAEKYVKDNDLPVIVVESFSNNSGKLVKGITNPKDKDLHPGSEYINADYYNGKFIVVPCIYI